MTTSDIRFAAKEYVVLKYQFSVLQMSEAVWEMLVERTMEDMLDAYYESREHGPSACEDMD